MTLITSKGDSNKPARNQPSNGRNTNRVWVQQVLFFFESEFQIQMRAGSRLFSASSILKKFIDKCSRSETKSGETIVRIVKPNVIHGISDYYPHKGPTQLDWGCCFSHGLVRKVVSFIEWFNDPVAISKRLINFTISAALVWPTTAWRLSF